MELVSVTSFAILFHLYAVAAAPSLVKNPDKSIRALRAMVEELQQVCETNNIRLAENERQL